VRIAFSRWERPVQWTLSCGDDTVQINPEPRFVLNDYAGVQQASWTDWASPRFERHLRIGVA